MRRALLLALTLAAACSGKNRAFCDEQTPCPDPTQICDLAHRTCDDPPADAAPATFDATPSGCGAAHPCTDPALPLCNPDTGLCEAKVDPTCDATHRCLDPAKPMCDLTTMHCVADPDAPTITQTATQVEDERADAITFPAATASGLPHHVHSATALPAVLRPGLACPDVHKYAYLLDADASNTDEASPNPLAVGFDIADASGVDVATVAYRLRNPATGFASPWLAAASELVVSGSGTAVHADLTVHRSAVPELGQRSGSWEVDLKADDLGGLEASGTACFSLDLIPAPLAVRPVASATGTGSLFGLLLSNDTTGIPDLLLGTGGPFGVASFQLQNYTQEELYVRVTPEAVAPSVCSRSYRRASLATARVPVNINCDNAAAPGCSTKHAMAYSATNNEACATPPAPALVLDDGGQPLSSCAGCPTGVYRLRPKGGASSTTLFAKLEVTEAPGLRPFPNSTTAIVSSKDYTLTYFPTDSPTVPSSTAHLTGNLETTYTRCSSLVMISVDPEHYACRQTSTYQIYRALMRITMTWTGVLAEVEPRLAPDVSTEPPVSLTFPSGLTWLTNESPGLPLQP